MRKFSLTILGFISSLGIIFLIYVFFNLLLDLIKFGTIYDWDALQWTWMLIVPTIYSSILFIKSLRDKLFYDKYKSTINYLVRGITITLVLTVSLFSYFVITNEHPIFMMFVISALAVGLAISFIISLCGLIEDKIKLKKTLKTKTIS